MNLNQILRTISFIGIFLVLFLPFYIAESLFFPFITGKNFAFRIIVEIMFSSWILLVLRDRSYAPRRSFILWAYATLVLIMSAADLFGVNPYKSFWSNFERMEGLVTHLHLFAYFIVLGSLFRTERIWNAFWKTSLGVSAAMCLYGIAQLTGMIAINQSTVRLDGTFGNAAYLAIYVAIHIFIAAFFLVREKGMGKRLMYGALVLLESFILYHTATRGTVLGVIAGGAVAAALIALFARNEPRLRKSAAIAVVALIVLVGGFLMIRNTEFVQKSPVLERFASISLQETTTKSRFLIWNMAWQGFLERPILGWGHENFNYVFNKYYDPRMYNQEPWFDRTHDVLLDWLIDSGALGLIAYLTFFGSVLYFLWKRTGFSVAEKGVLSGLLAAYFVHNIFVFDNLISYVLFFSIAAYVYSLTAGSREGEHGGEILRKETVMYGIAPLVLILLAVVIYIGNIKPIRAGQTLVDTMRTEASNPAASLASYRKALAYATFGTTEIRERLLGTAVDIGTATPEVKAQFVALAKSEMEKQLERTPNDARHQLFFGSFLDKIGLYDDAIAHLNEALTASPNKQSILIAQGAAYVDAKDYESAYGSFKKAYELETSNEEAKVFYVVGALYAGHSDEADALLASLDSQTVIASNQILNAYAELGRFDKVLEIWQARIKADPNNLQFRLSYAATLLKLGRKAEAIAELERVKAAEPKSAEQIDFYIHQIKAGKDPTR